MRMPGSFHVSFVGSFSDSFHGVCTGSFGVLFVGGFLVAIRLSLLYLIVALDYRREASRALSF